MADNKKFSAYDPQLKERQRSFVSDTYSSKTLLRTAQTISTNTIIKETKGIGDIEQILLRSTGTTYRVQIIIDNEVVWNDSYAFFLAHTADIVGVSAYAAGGRDFLSIQNLFFQKDFQITIQPTGSILFDVVLVRYNIREEIKQMEL
jgi:hypothetical protein